MAAVATAPAAIPVPPGASPGAGPARTARLITSETAQSALKLAPDGRLPELHLDEDEAKKKGDEDEGTTMNPLVLFGLLTLSVAMSVAMVLIDWSAPPTSRAEERGKARAVIEEKFFGGGSLNRTKPLEPYQELLRDAQREHFRGNLRKERDLYRKVLDMLRAERAAGDRGLTGSLTNDRLLEKQLLILLTEG